MNTYILGSEEGNEEAAERREDKGEFHCFIEKTLVNWVLGEKQNISINSCIIFFQTEIFHEYLFDLLARSNW